MAIQHSVLETWDTPRLNGPAQPEFNGAGNKPQSTINMQQTKNGGVKANMKKLSTMLMFLLLGVFLLAGSAWATYYTPSVSQIHEWQFMGATNNSGITGGLLDFFGSSENDAASIMYYTDSAYGEFDLAFEQGTNSYSGGALIGYRETVDLSTFDTFELSVSNVNESTWDYALYVASGDSSNDGKMFIGLGSTYLTGPGSGSLVLQAGSSAVLSLDLTRAANYAGVDLSNAYIGYAVGAILPTGDNDYMSETRVAPVPEPATMLLLGVGLCGLAFVGRKKLIKQG